MNFKFIPNLRIVLTIALLASVLSTYKVNAQAPATNGNPNLIALKGSISMIIIDASDKTPLEYSQAVLYSAKDSTMTGGAVADNTGLVILDNIPVGKYYAQLNFIGYEKRIINEITLSSKDLNIVLDTISLKLAATNLRGVDIIAEQTQVEYHIDKKVVTVGKDLSSAGESAVQVLENVPSVQVDIEGNVSIRGSSNFTVLIDGKPSVLSSSDILEQTPASAIERIEIITNPSVKYDPDGVGGIVNIIMRKNKKVGLNGIINVDIGTYKRYGADFLLNYRNKKVNYFIGGNWNDKPRYGNATNYRETYFDDTTFIFDSEFDPVRGHKGKNLRGGFDYYIDDKNVFSFSGTVGEWGWKSQTDSRVHEFTDPTSLEQYSISNSQYNRTGSYYSVNTNYTKKFKNTGHQIVANVDYSSSANEGINEQLQYLSDQDWAALSSNILTGVNTIEEGKGFNTKAKIDYSLPLGKVRKFETGAQLRYADDNSDNILEFWEENDWATSDQYSSNLSFNRTIASTYATWRDEWKGFGYQVGVRGEYTNRVISQADSSIAVERPDFFPSLHISRKLSADQTVFVSYSKRIRRPRNWFLGFIPRYIDAYNIRQGNPALLPQYTDSYELGYQLFKKKTQFSAEAFYRSTENVFTRVSYLNDDGILVSTWENLNKDQSIGTELMFNSKLNDWLSLNVSGSAYYYAIDGDIIEEGVETNTITYNSRFNIQIRPTKTSRIQLTGRYRGPRISAQGHRYSSYGFNLALRQDFLKNKLSVTLQSRDILGTERRKMESSTDVFYSLTEYYNKPYQINLSISYKINNYKSEKGMNGSSDGGGMFEGDF